MLKKLNKIIQFQHIIFTNLLRTKMHNLISYFPCDIECSTKLRTVEL